MKQWNRSMLIGGGVALSAFSFLYEYMIADKNVIFTVGIMLFDIVWLGLNLFYLFFLENEKIFKSAVNAILACLMYFSGLSGLVLMLAEEYASAQILLKSLETLVYLGPMLIILLPIFRFVFQILDQM